MSKRTFIPKWNPGNNLGNTSIIGERIVRRFNSRFDGMGNNMTVRTLQEGKKSVMGTKPWHGVQNSNDANKELEEVDQDNCNSANRLINARLPQRVGMFRNAKQSQIIYNNISTAVRKLVERDIQHLVAPESDVEWAPRVPDNLNVAKNQERIVQMQHLENGRLNADRELCLINDEVYDEEEIEEEEEEFCREDDVICAESDDNNDLDQNNNRIKLINRKRRSIADDTSCQLFRSSDLKRMANSFAQGDNIANVIRQNNQFCTPMRGHCSGNNLYHIGAEELDDNIVKNYNVSASASTPYPSTTLARRMLSTLPVLGLTDDDRKDYDTVALSMLTASITRASESHSSESNMLNSFMNKTHAIAICSDDECDVSDVEVANQHDFIFPLESQLINGITTSSPPATPPLEKEFNQTLIANPFSGFLSPENATHVLSCDELSEDNEQSNEIDNIEDIEGEVLYSLVPEENNVDNEVLIDENTTYWPYIAVNGNTIVNNSEYKVTGPPAKEQHHAGTTWEDIWREKSSYF